LKNETLWRPTKYVEHSGRWRGSRDARHLGRGSRVTADLTAAAYSRVLAAHAHGDLLDLGCGTAPAYGMYRPYVSTVTCVDWDNTAHPSPHLDVEADLREPLPFQDASYDTVVLTDVLEHMPYPDPLVSEIRRVLRPQGTVVIGVPFMYGIHEAPHDHHRYTQFRLRLFCADHDLKVVELFAYGGPGAVVLDLAAKCLSAVPFLKVAAGLPALLSRPTRPDNAATPLPLGYVLVARKPQQASP
jgi:SAM-dependent methyltransferase